MAFIGRERELALVASALQRAAEGEPTRVALSGPLGIGLSSLLDELGDRLAGVAGVVVARARCYSVRSGVPYGPLAAALAGPLDAAPDKLLGSIDGPAAYDLCALVPSLRPRFEELGAPPVAPTLEAPEQRGARMQESLLAVIERLSRVGAVCLVLEDIGRADPATREFVGALVRMSRRMPLALIISYHSDELHRGHPAWSFLRDIEDAPDIDRLVVPPLAHTELVALVEQIRGDRPSLDFMAAVMEGSGGNPLLASQLVAAQAELKGVRLSDPLEETVHARLARLPDAVVRGLRLLSAAGRPMTVETLLELNLPEGHLTRTSIDALAKSGFARQLPAGLEIVHELCAEAIEGLALPAERQALHVALATELADQPAEAAWHWDAAGRPAEALAAHLSAALDAQRLDPGRTALLHQQRALELLRSEPATPELLAATAASAAAAGMFRRAAVLMEQAITRRAGGRIERLTKGSRLRGDDLDELGAMSEQLGRYRRDGGDPVGARQAFDTAVELVPPQPTGTRARALASLAQDLMLEGRFEQSAKHAREARHTAQAVGDEALVELGHATCTLGVDEAYGGRLDEGLRLLEEAVEVSRRAGRLDDVVRAFANQTTLLDLDSRREAALAIVQTGIAEAERCGLGLTYGAFLRGNAADILFKLGRWTEAERECRAALEFPPAGVAWFSPILYLGLVLVESRADEEAGRLVGRTILQLEAVPAGQWSALVQRAAVSLALWQSDLAGAQQAAARGWERVVETGDAGQIAASAATVLEACAAAAEAGRDSRDLSAVADAGALAARVLPVAEQAVAGSDLSAGLGARREADLQLATARAHAMRLRGRPSASAWSDLAEAWQAIPVPYEAAKARWWQAAAALTAGDGRREATRALGDAWRISAELPARPLRRALLELAGRGRIALPADGRVAIPIVPDERAAKRATRPAAPDLVDQLRSAPLNGNSFGLSPRESTVLAVLAEGRTNREIAERLFISQRTVAVHVRRILAKLGVKGRVEAAGMAIRLGLIPDAPANLSGAPRR
jgi:DNA-binding CsgD family transcriptional regulator/tetratricopeptide (TPR) repeat protein